MWTAVGTGLGAAVGAVTNFMINRHWSFRASEAALHAQAVRYALVSAISLGLNVLGTEGALRLGVSYGFSRIVVSLLVGFCFNFPLHRYFVFRNA
jgi:putative flippase GtrA